MKTFNVSLPTEDTRYLCKKIADILTISATDADALITAHPEDAVSLLHAFETAEAKMENGRQWLGHTMVSLPHSHWAQAHGVYSVTPTKDASLRYLTLDDRTKDLTVQAHVLHRQYLVESLVAALDADTKEKYAAMLQWVRVAPAGQGVGQSLLSDVAIGSGIYRVESKFDNLFAANELKMRGLLKVPSNTFTPSWMLVEVANAVPKAVLQELRVSTDSFVPEPPNLLVQVLCNMAANRALLELAKTGELAHEALEVGEPLLMALNQVGIHEMPEVEDDGDIRQLLLAWFGPDGSIRQVPGFNRPFGEHTLSVALQVADTVQQDYLRTSGALANRQNREVHASPQYKLIFTLAVMACFYGKTKVNSEFRGADTANYAVFPESATEPLGPHAKSLVKSIYGQFFYANHGWYLNANHVREYALALTHRRGRKQELIFEVFKTWPAQRLQLLHTYIQPHC